MCGRGFGVSRALSKRAEFVGGTAETFEAISGGLESHLVVHFACHPFWAVWEYLHYPALRFYVDRR